MLFLCSSAYDTLLQSIVPETFHAEDWLLKLLTPYDIYSMADLKKVNAEKYKVIVFLNEFYISDEHRDYINNVLEKDDRSIVFVVHLTT